MHNFCFLIFAGGLCLAFGAFVEADSNPTEERQWNDPCPDPCLKGCTNFTRTDGRLEVVCENLNCTCLPDGIPREVTRLVFTGNNLRNVKEGMFTKLPELEELYLRANKIGEFNRRAFVGLPKLRLLDLSNNYIVEGLPMELFLHMRDYIEDLRLSRIERSDTKFRWLINLRHLRNLTYDQNLLVVFPNFLSSVGDSKTPNLTELHLEDNNIRQIYSRHMLGLDSLEKLFLCRNVVGSIQSGAFNVLKSLKYLNLDGNPLLKLEHRSLLSNSIEYMSLARTGLFLEPQYSSKNPLTINNSMTSLDLSGNNLNSHQLSGFVKYYKALRTLDVNQNKLEILTIETFQNLPSLEELLAANNFLTQISESSLPSKLWTQLKTVDLSGNPFRCDCKLFKFSQWIKENNFSYSTKLLNNMQCVSYLNEKKHSLIVSKAENYLKMKCLVEESEWFLWALTATVVVISFLSTFASAVHRFRWNIRYWIFSHKIKTRRFMQVRDKKHYTYDAFISYSETDSRWVIHQLLPRLESEYHLRLCIHQRDWLAGRDIAENIVLSIEQSRKTVLIVSNAFAVSQWCHFEMTMALSRVFQDDRDNLVLVMLEEIADCNMSPRLLMLTERQTYVQWDDHALGQQLFWVKLRQALAKPEESVADALPPLDVFVA